MSAHDRAVDHNILIVRVFGQNIEYLFPNTGLCPPRKAFVSSFPLAIPPGRSCQCAPERKTHKQ